VYCFSKNAGCNEQVFSPFLLNSEKKKIGANPSRRVQEKRTFNSKKLPYRAEG